MADTTIIKATITIYEAAEYDGAPPFYLLITGELFGPFDTEDDALDAIPHALRSLP